MRKVLVLYKGLALVLVIALMMISVNSTPIYGADEATIKELKEKLIIANKILDNQGLASPMGHISVRIPGTETFLITRSIAPGMAALDDIVVCNIEGKVIQGKYSETFGEVAGHAAVYKKRKDITSVAHTHSPYVIALSMTGNTLLNLGTEALKVGFGTIGLYEKFRMLEDQEVGEEVADLIRENKAVILRGHGAVVVGKSIEGCTVACIYLEKAARYQLMAASAGKLATFTEEEKKPIVEFLKKIGALAGTSSSDGRAWEYYKFLLKK
jgi:ribulose-5-phosphate 4-epimerase/fuculose-1-phosphate aldolase